MDTEHEVESPVIPPKKETLPPMKKKLHWKYIAIGVAVLALLIAAIVGYRKQITRSDKNSDATVVEVSPTATPTVSPSVSTPIPSDSPSPSPDPSASPTATPSTNAQADAIKYYQNKDYANSITSYKVAVAAESSPTKLAELYVSLGNSYRENNQLDEAVTSYKQAIAENAKNGDAYLNEAAILWGQTKQDDAKKVLQAGIDQQTSKDADLRNLLSVYEVRSS